MSSAPFLSIFRRRNSTFFTTRPECKAQVDDYRYPKYRKFDRIVDAWRFVLELPRNQSLLGMYSAPPPPYTPPSPGPPPAAGPPLGPPGPPSGMITVPSAPPTPTHPAPSPTQMAPLVATAPPTPLTAAASPAAAHTSVPATASRSVRQSRAAAPSNVRASPAPVTPRASPPPDYRQVNSETPGRQSNRSAQGSTFSTPRPHHTLAHASSRGHFAPTDSPISALNGAFSALNITSPVRQYIADDRVHD